MSGLRYQFTRVFSILTVSAMVIGLILSGALTSHEMFSNIRVFSDTALVAFATVLLLRLLPLVYYLPTTRSMRGVCSAVYRVADIVLTYFLNGLRFVLSLFDILTGLQAQLLFNTAYARTGELWSVLCQAGNSCGATSSTWCLKLMYAHSARAHTKVLGRAQACTVDGA